MFLFILLKFSDKKIKLIIIKTTYVIFILKIQYICFIYLKLK